MCGVYSPYWCVSLHESMQACGSFTRMTLESGCGGKCFEALDSVKTRHKKPDTPIPYSSH